MHNSRATTSQLTVQGPSIGDEVEGVSSWFCCGAAASVVVIVSVLDDFTAVKGNQNRGGRGTWRWVCWMCRRCIKDHSEPRLQGLEPPVACTPLVVCYSVTIIGVWRRCIVDDDGVDGCILSGIELE